jgi:hypothetical protein
MRIPRGNSTRGCAGKTTTCRELQKVLPRNVFLDGDWRWDMHPFVVADETKATVNSNITHLLNGFLTCPEFENVISVLMATSLLVFSPARLNASRMMQATCRMCGKFTLSALTVQHDHFVVQPRMLSVMTSCGGPGSAGRTALAACQ